MTYTLHLGDCRNVLAELPAASVDSVVTDPPYHLTSITKRFGGSSSAPAYIAIAQRRIAEETARPRQGELLAALA